MAAVHLNTVTPGRAKYPAGIAVSRLDFRHVLLIEGFGNDFYINGGTTNLFVADLIWRGDLRHKSRAKLVYLIDQRPHFILDSWYIQTGLLKYMPDNPFALEAVSPTHDEPDTAACQIRVEFSVAGGKPVFFIGKIVDSGGPYKTISEFDTRKLEWLKKSIKSSEMLEKQFLSENIGEE